MYSSLFYSVGIPVIVTLSATFLLHLLGRLFFLSAHRRSQYLYSETPWLPLRYGTEPLEGEEVEFQSAGRIILRGTYVSHRTTRCRGVVLFLHELNGNRSNISPYVKQLTDSGFDILSFDFRNHGTSDATYHGHPTPWVTMGDMEDVRAALGYLSARLPNSRNICLFGLGKGATVALCAAGSDDRVRSIVLDAPIPENRLFDKNCWDLLVKSARISKRSFPKFVALFSRAVLYTLACPFIALASTWRRRVLGIWYDCRFVNPWPLAKKVRQPILILHGHADSKTRADQIQAFCDRMPIRPRLWIVPQHRRQSHAPISEDCVCQVAEFFIQGVRPAGA